MRRAKQQSKDLGVGDWSTTGTFLRKPTGGWLHEDRELQSGLSINYSVQYLGSIVVHNSMRTLQFNLRTQVTKEAILRLAENSGNVFIGKKKKVPKQIDKILGALEIRWAGEANLSVSVDSLKISNEVGGMVMLNHSLPSISFASGGDGATTEYIGYVAKDPVHGRACHVFECPRTSQFVLATIGQAFELRYKMYLGTPASGVQPVEPGASLDSDAWRITERGRSVHNNTATTATTTTADVHPMFAGGSPPDEAGGIYSDIPDLPSDLPPDIPPPDSPPPPIPSPRYTLPRSDSDESGHHPRLDNPYDTMEISMGENREAPNMKSSGYYSAVKEPSSIYEDAELPPTTTANNNHHHPNNGTPEHEAGSEYSTTFVSIRQSTITDSLDQINLTPDPPNYSNVDISGGGGKRPTTRKPPTKPTPFKPKTSPTHQVPADIPPKIPSSEHRSYKNGNTDSGSNHRHHNQASPLSSPHPPSPTPASRNSYDPPIQLKSKPPPIKKKPTITSHTRPGLYDNPDEILLARKKNKPQKPAREGIICGMLARDEEEGDTVYDIPEEGVYNTPEGVYDDKSSAKHNGATVPPSPKFDDGIYMDAPVSKQKPKNMAPDPLGPLSQQQYFHGPLSRVEAEALLVSDGEFLVRESSKKPGQYVLTGMADSKIQHLLLMDKQGKVKSKDREFESVSHLIKHFTESKFPLTIGNSQVYLKKPVINEFLHS